MNVGGTAPGPVVVVTGGAGFLGRALVRELRKASPEAPLDPREIRVLDVRPAPAELSGVNYVRGDILAPDDLRRTFAGADLVFHLAALIDWGQNAPERVHAVNATGTRNVVEACRAAGVPALVATSSLDVNRLVVVYHGVGTEASRFLYTYVGDPNPGQYLNAAFDSDAPPSLVAYPYYNRIYFLRGDPNSGATPRHIKYGSYTMATGWTGLTDLTAAYEAMGGISPDAVRTDRGLAMTEYGVGGTTRLNFTFITLPMPNNRELWHGALREPSPGVLSTDGYRAVPLFPLSTGTSQAAGGLAEAVSGGVLWHAWMPATLSTWTKCSE